MSPNRFFPARGPFPPSVGPLLRRTLIIVGGTDVSERAAANVSIIMRGTRIAHGISFARGRFPTSAPPLFLGEAMAAHALRHLCGWMRKGGVCVELIESRMIILPSGLVVILIVLSSSSRWQHSYSSVNWVPFPESCVLPCPVTPSC